MDTEMKATLKKKQANFLGSIALPEYAIQGSVIILFCGNWV